MQPATSQVHLPSTDARADRRPARNCLRGRNCTTIYERRGNAFSFCAHAINYDASPPASECWFRAPEQPSLAWLFTVFVEMKGVTRRRIPNGHPGAGILVTRLHYTADPTMTPERVAQLRSRYSSEARWRREMEIEYEALEGQLLIPEFMAQRNVVPPFDVSNTWKWTIWMGADPHMRTKHAFSWVAFGDDGEAHVCGELWPAAISDPLTVKHYADLIKWLESDSEDKPRSWEWANGKSLKVLCRYMDTHGSAANSDEGDDFFSAYRRHDLFFQPAKKGHAINAAARDAIGSMLLPTEYVDMEGNGDSKPTLTVSSSCPELISEFQNVRYPEGDAERPADERPMTYRKHVLDCVTYVFSGRPGFIIPQKPRDTFEPIYPNIGY